MPRALRPARCAVLSILLAIALSWVGVLSCGGALAYPTAPLSWDRALLSNLSAPSVGPGGSTSVSFLLNDPSSLAAPLSDVVLTLEVYALNGFPGDAVGPVPVADPPVLENATGSGTSVNISLVSLAPGSSYLGSIPVTTSATTPAGTYAVRTALSFVENSTAYRFESRGWFTESAWENATVQANGTATINASRLGVSGIVPETAVYVASSVWPIAWAVIVAVGLVLVGLGAWLYFRRASRSSSGAANVPDPGATHAPKAFGRSRSKPGDSRSN